MRHRQTQSGPSSIVSTIKVNQAGFTEMMDTEVISENGLGSPARVVCCLDGVGVPQAALV